MFMVTRAAVCLCRVP